MYISKDTNKSYVLNIHDELHNKYTPVNIELGIEGEKMIIRFLTEHKKLRIEANNLDVNIYPNEHGWDICIPEIDFIAEVKNLNGDYYLDMNYVEDQLLKICESSARIKVIFISHNRFTKMARRYLRSCRVHIVEWGYQIKKGTSWNKALSRLHRTFNHIFMKYNDLFNSVLSFRDNSTNLSTTTLDNCVLKHNILSNNDITKIELTNKLIKLKRKKALRPPGGWRGAVVTISNKRGEQ